MKKYELNLFADYELTENEMKETILSFLLYEKKVCIHFKYCVWNMINIENEPRKQILDKLNFADLIFLYCKTKKIEMNLDFNSLSVYKLIEIFFWIKSHIHICKIAAIKSINRQNSELKVFKITTPKIKSVEIKIKMFLATKELIFSNWKRKIIFKRKSKFLFSNSQDFNQVCNDFLQVKNDITPNALVKKEQVIALLKSRLDYYMNKKNVTFNQNFLVLDNNNLRTYWQVLFSHRNGEKKDKIEKWKKIHDQFKNSTLLEKHELYNDIFIAILLIVIKDS